MNATINLFAFAHLEPTSDGQVSFNAFDVAQTHKGPAESFIEPSGSAILHKGVYNRIVRQFNNGRPLPIGISTTVDVPAGSGLGSSSTLVVALVDAFRAYLSLPLGEYDVARVACEIERGEIGLAGGRQDRYAAAFGGFNFMEFSAGERVIVNPLRIKSNTLNELESSLVLCHTGRSRASAEIIEQQKSNVTQNDKASIHGMLALRREAIDMKEAILRGDIRKIGEASNRGWLAKQSTASGVSNKQINDLIEGAFSAGAYAGKVSGAGGGGFIFLLVDPLRRHEVRRMLSELGGIIVPCNFVHQGVESWRC
jgi:D-glycero-alpha-D-manno-heptose-7-phosphate kinase